MFFDAEPRFGHVKPAGEPSQASIISDEGADLALARPFFAAVLPDASQPEAQVCCPPHTQAQ